MKKWVLIGMLCATIAGITGCNLFGWSSSPTSASDYMNEGRRKLNDGDFSGALSDFRNAVRDNPNSSDARFACAKARLLVSGINSLDVLSSLSQFGMNNGDTIPFFNQRIWPENKATDLYQALTEVNDMLRPIFWGTTSGTFRTKDVALDYGVSQIVYGLVQLRDNSGNTVIHVGTAATDDIDINLLFIGNSFQFANFLQLYQTRGAGRIDTILYNASNLCDTLRVIIQRGLLPADSSFNTQGLSDMADSLKGVMNRYRNVGQNIGNIMNARDDNSDGLADESIYGAASPFYRYYFRSRNLTTVPPTYVIDSVSATVNGSDCGGMIDPDPSHPRAWTRNWVLALLAARPTYIDSVFKVDSVRLRNNGGRP